MTEKIKIQLSVRIDSLVTIDAPQWLLDDAKEHGWDTTDLEAIASYLEVAIGDQGLTEDDISTGLADEVFLEGIREIEVENIFVEKP